MTVNMMATTPTPIDAIKEFLLAFIF